MGQFYLFHDVILKMEVGEIIISSNLHFASVFVLLCIQLTEAWGDY